MEGGERFGFVASALALLRNAPLHDIAQEPLVNLVKLRHFLKDIEI